VTWTPEVDETVIAFADTDRSVSGRVVEDFGDDTTYPVHVNDTRIAEAARRFAILTDDGGLVFADAVDLRPVRPGGDQAP
jgi:hypothetical protein